jgi:hypothetical protein
MNLGKAPSRRLDSIGPSAGLHRLIFARLGIPNLTFVGATDIAIVTGPPFVTETKIRDLKLAFRERGLNELTFSHVVNWQLLSFPDL